MGTLEETLELAIGRCPEGIAGLDRKLEGVVGRTSPETVEKESSRTGMQRSILRRPAEEMSVENFEEAMARLEKIVEQLEKGELPIEEAMKAFEEGMKLVHFCTKKLEEVEKRVSVLIQDSGGAYTRVPFDTEDESKGG
jgi:exodeoxyribonuclease VII small subunit